MLVWKLDDQSRQIIFIVVLGGMLSDEVVAAGPQKPRVPKSFRRTSVRKRCREYARGL